MTTTLRDWCKSCGWHLAIARTVHGLNYCRTCAPHAHMLPVSTDGVASVAR